MLHIAATLPQDPKQSASPSKRTKASDTAAVRAHLSYRAYTPQGIPWLKHLHLALGDCSLVWDTATTEGYFRYLFEALKEGLLPEMPILPFHMITNIWEMHLSLQSIYYRLVDSMGPCREGGSGEGGGREVATLATGPALVSILMPWDGSISVEVDVKLQQIASPADANEPISRHSPSPPTLPYTLTPSPAPPGSHLPRGTRPIHLPRSSWTRVAYPSNPDSAGVYFKYQTYTEYTTRKPSEIHGIQSSVQLHFPP